MPQISIFTTPGIRWYPNLADTLSKLFFFPNITWHDAVGHPQQQSVMNDVVIWHLALVNKFTYTPQAQRWFIELDLHWTGHINLHVAWKGQ